MIGVNPKTGHTYLWEDFIARNEAETEMIRGQIWATILGASIGAIITVFIVACIQSGHAPIF